MGGGVISPHGGGGISGYESTWGGIFSSVGDSPPSTPVAETLDNKVDFFGIEAPEPRCTLKWSWTLLLELCTFDSSETRSKQLSMVKSIYDALFTSQVQA